MDIPLEIFFSYAHEDKDLMNDVRRQLIVYERNGRILKWHDRMIPPGADWRSQIDDRLKTAQIVLLFMSPHFIESRYCYEVESEVALTRLKSGDARVVPIILRPCAWEATPFGNLQALPEDGRPISRWTDRDEACLNAARGVIRVVDELNQPQTSVLAIKTATVIAATDKNQRIKEPTDLMVVYCSRCGNIAGVQSACTGQYTHHSFTRGSTRDFCSRCGVYAGTRTTCTGQYTHHEFTSNFSDSMHCSRCGVLPGKRTTCTGQYTHHSFTEI